MLHRPMIWQTAVSQSAAVLSAEYGLYSSDRHASIQKIDQGHPVVIWCHQPNLLASWTVLSAGLHAFLLARQQGAVAVFVVIDYDDASDQRFRAPSLPPKHSTSDDEYTLPGAVPRSKRRCVARSVTMSSETARSWSAKYNEVIRAWRNLLGTETGRCDDILDLNHLANTRITDAGMLQIVHDLMQVGVHDLVPARASDIWASLFGDAIDLARFLVTSKLARPDTLLWWICPNCKCRRKAVVTAVRNKSMVWAKCDVCQLETNQNSNDLKAYRWAPQVGLCNLIDMVLGRPSAICLYSGSKGHYERSARLAAQIGVNPPRRIYTASAELPVPSIALDRKYGRKWLEGRFSLRFHLDTSSLPIT